MIKIQPQVYKNTRDFVSFIKKKNQIKDLCGEKTMCTLTASIGFIIFNYVLEVHLILFLNFRGLIPS